MSIVPTTLRLATAICWSGTTRAAAIWSRLPSAASACWTRSIWERPIEFSHCCHGSRIVGSFVLMSGIDAANWAIDVASAPAATTTRTTSVSTTTAYTRTVAAALGRRGIASTMRETIGLMMNASSQARKKVRRMSPK